jgi:hypothetical protein
LRDALVGLSASTGDGRTEIVVLDITRPACRGASPCKRSSTRPSSTAP